MEFKEGSRGIYKSQQKNQLPSEVTAEDMMELLVEESKRTLRVQLWEFELEDFDEADVRLLLKLVWEVNTGMKMRDVEFEARRLLSSPEAAPPQFQHPKIISQAQMYTRSLTEQQQEARGSKLLGLREMVMEVVPKVLQGFWLPPPNTCFNMPSQQLCKMAVGVTKAIEDRVSTALSSMLCRVPFSRSIRDYLVLSIQEKVREGHTRDVLVKKLNCFAAEVLNIITDVTAREICALFQSQTHSKVSSIQPADVVDGAEDKTSPAEDVDEEPGLEEDTEPISEPDSAVVTPPPAPVTPTTEPPAITVVQEGLTTSQAEPVQQPTSSLKPDCAVVSPPPSPVTPLAEPPANIDFNETAEQPAPHLELKSTVIPAPPSVLDSEHKSEEPTRDPDSAVVSATPPPLTPADEPPVITTNQEDVKFSQVGAVQQPTPSPEPPHVTPPTEVPPSVLDGESKSEEPTREPDSAVATTPPSPLTPADEPPVITAVQDELIITEQPVRVDESFHTTTEVKKTEVSGFSSFFSWL